MTARLQEDAHPGAHLAGGGTAAAAAGAEAAAYIFGYMPDEQA